MAFGILVCDVARQEFQFLQPQPGSVIDQKLNEEVHIDGRLTDARMFVGGGDLQREKNSGELKQAQN